MKAATLTPLTFVLLLAMLGDSLSTSIAPPLLGGWQPIANLKSANIRMIANFAVTQYNRRSNTRLKLTKVVRGESQVVSGINYRLYLETNSPIGKGYYVAVVWDRPWLNTLTLTSFTAVLKH